MRRRADDLEHIFGPILREFDGILEVDRALRVGRQSIRMRINIVSRVDPEILRLARDILSKTNPPCDKREYHVVVVAELLDAQPTQGGRLMDIDDFKARLRCRYCDILNIHAFKCGVNHALRELDKIGVIVYLSRYGLRLCEKYLSTPNDDDELSAEEISKRVSESMPNLISQYRLTRDESTVLHHILLSFFDGWIIPSMPFYGQGTDYSYVFQNLINKLPPRYLYESAGRYHAGNALLEAVGLI